MCSSFPDDSVDCVVTSPPYWGKRDYKIDDQVGVEEKAKEYVGEIIELGKTLYRVVDGSFWLNMGDTYNGCSIIRPDSMESHTRSGDDDYEKQLSDNREESGVKRRSSSQYGFSRQSRLFIPSRVAIGLCEVGWLCRDRVIWNKENPKPEGRVSTRLTQSHETIFRFASGERVMFDLDRLVNQTDVWEFPTSSKDHPAPFPDELALRTIMLTTDPGDTVLDPFCGSGTVCRIAKQLGRDYIGVDIHPEFVEQTMGACNEA